MAGNGSAYGAARQRRVQSPKGSLMGSLCGVSGIFCGRGVAARVAWPHWLAACCLVAMLWTVPAHVRAQVHFRPVAADFSLLTQYRDAAMQDTIWVHFREPGDMSPMAMRGWCADNQPRRLVVRRWSTDGWEERYEELMALDGVKSIDFAALTPGAYQLLGIKGTDTIRQLVWLMIDDVKFERIAVDNTCLGLTMAAQFSVDFSSIRYDKFAYYDLSQSPPRELSDLGQRYFDKVVWEDDKGKPAELYGLRVQQHSPPPYERVAYRLKVTNLFGREFMGETGSVDPVAVSAKFKVLLNKRGSDQDPTWDDAGSPPRGISPVRMRLQSDAKNANRLVWSMRNDARAIRAGAPDTLLRQDISAGQSTLEPSPSLFTAGVYKIILAAQNTATGCADTLAVDFRVDSSLISPQAIPNVFSPNGDGVNDRFAFIDRDKNVRAIRDFDLQIFNRNGHRVYRYHGNVEAWDGWNGKRNGDGGDLDVGVYFYIIRAVGWDGRRYQGDEYKGVVHLFR